MLASFSSSKLTILRTSLAKFIDTCQTFQSPEFTKAHLFSHKRITTTRWSVTSHLKSVNVCLWDTQHSPSSLSSMLIPEWFIKPHIKAYNTPSNGNIYFRVRQSLSEYFNVITSSPLFQESTHPGVASTLCSTLGTTSYFSVSLSLLVLRVQVALHL